MNEYVKEQYYEGLGKYLGITDVYPYNESYYIRVHRFAGESPKDRRGCPEIKEIEIERIERCLKK